MTFSRIETETTTIQSLHSYSRILGSIRAACTDPHPRWWHASLQITDAGLTTGPFSLTGSAAGSLTLGADSISGVGVEGPFEVVITGPADHVGREVLSRLGGKIDVDPTRWAAIPASGAKRADAQTYLSALVAIRDSFSEFKSRIEGEVGPVQLWPHHFDVAFEWFSPAVEVYEEEDGPKEFSKQIGFGFSPGDDTDPQPYFYANPWPFDESFRAVELPQGASWHTEGWNGGFLRYTAVVESGSGLLHEFMSAVWEGTHLALE